METKPAEIAPAGGFVTTIPECVNALPATVALYATDRYIHTCILTYLHTYIQYIQYIHLQFPYIYIF